MEISKDDKEKYFWKQQNERIGPIAWKGKGVTLALGVSHGGLSSHMSKR